MSWSDTYKEQRPKAVELYSQAKELIAGGVGHVDAVVGALFFRVACEGAAAVRHLVAKFAEAIVVLAPSRIDFGAPRGCAQDVESTCLSAGS